MVIEATEVTTIKLYKDGDAWCAFLPFSAKNNGLTVNQDPRLTPNNSNTRSDHYFQASSIGEDIQEGVTGFASSPSDALRALAIVLDKHSFEPIDPNTYRKD